ncbi:MAG: hypothetical protein JWO82_1947 [Akkermansiaceae bacterium]|nr:hypothetical protein [Akkermansiaceae bacterium]
MPDPKPKQEHPLANILVNVLIPVLILSFLSKDPDLQVKLGKTAHFWQIGPLKAIVLALLLPIGYGIWHFIQTRKGNFFSVLGLISVALSGGLTFYLWNADGTVKPDAGLLYGVKEGLIPLILAVAILNSGRTENPLIRVFLYNDTLFDIPKIESKVAEKMTQSGYTDLQAGANKIFAASFILSAFMNVGLALWFFRGFNSSAPDALENYNAIVGKLHFAGFAAIGIPLMGILYLILNRLLKGLRELTGLTDEELMLPR